MDNSLSLAFKRCGFKSRTYQFIIFYDLFFIYLFVFLKFCINGYFYVNLGYVYASNGHVAHCFFISLLHKHPCGNLWNNEYISD